MFVQCIEGRVGDRDGLRRQYDGWLAELSGGAEGWLGVTGGITSDGTGFLAVRFASIDVARRNSARAEQDRWWAETERCFDGPVTFTDYTDVDLLRGGGSDEAGFVQVIEGRVTDAGRARELTAEMEPHLAAARPDVLGGYVAMRDDGVYTQVVYFTSEAEARAGEHAPSRDEIARFDDEFAELHVDPPRYLDLTDPWMASA
jgi:hypothetical protein